MIPVPLGPLAAFDANEDELIVFDEIHNKLVIVNDAQLKKSLSIPVEYSSELYYWARVHYVTRNILLCLLKSHANKVYYFVSMKIDRESNQCLKLRSLKSRIYSTGYRIESHRAGSQFVFSMNNTEKREKFSPPKVSDREMFNKQVPDFRSSKSTPTSPLEVQQSFERLSLRSKESCENTRHNIREGVVVVVQCSLSGDIQANIVSLGKQRLGVKLRRVGSIRKWKDALGTKFMTRFDCENEEMLCEPVLSGSRALLLCRNDPSLCCILNTVINPVHGVGAAIQHKFNDGLRSTTGHSEPTRVSITSLPPDPSHLWSNVEVLEGAPLLVTVAPSTGYCLVFILNQLGDQTPRLFWKRHELSPVLAGFSPSQLFVRAKKNPMSQLCQLTIRALLNEKGTTKSFVEKVEFRI